MYLIIWNYGASLYKTDQSGYICYFKYFHNLVGVYIFYVMVFKMIIHFTISYNTFMIWNLAFQFPLCIPVLQLLQYKYDYLYVFNRRWDKFEDSYRVMVFSNGDKCWNGPDRSLKVFSCVNSSSLRIFLIFT